MKDRYTNIGLVRFCRLLGVTRQAYYQHLWHQQATNLEEDLILKQVLKIRSLQPVIGTRKLYAMLQPFILEHQIKIGRDALFDLLASRNLLVRRRKRRISTTQSKHWYRKYPNLIRNLQVSRPDELWVADITYYPIRKGYVYMSFLTDAYSHKIVGYNVSGNLSWKFRPY